MKTLIVGVGALGGVIGGRLQAAGVPVWMATRDGASAARLRATGLRVTGIGRPVFVEAPRVAPLDEYRDAFDLVVIATKARDAIEAAPPLVERLAPGGALLPIQNGGVCRILADRLGAGRVLGGLSNLGATMPSPGHYEQRNAGHLLVGEIAGGHGARAEHVRAWLGRAVEVRVTPNLEGAIWSKLVVNCSVTTIGAIAGRTMREYVASPEGRRLFDRTYDEALQVAVATGTRPERMLVDPVPPGWSGRSVPGPAHDAWLAAILDAYGDLKPSMLQDFERGRATEIDFINGHVVELGRAHGVAAPANLALVATAHAITRGELAPDPSLVARVLAACEPDLHARVRTRNLR